MAVAARVITVAAVVVIVCRLLCMQCLCLLKSLRHYKKSDLVPDIHTPSNFNNNGYIHSALGSQKCTKEDNNNDNNNDATHTGQVSAHLYTWFTVSTIGGLKIIYRLLSKL